MTADAKRSRLKPWRILRAAVVAFLVPKLAGWSPMTDAPLRTAFAVMVMAVAFTIFLRFERWIQDQREAAERGHSDP